MNHLKSGTAFFGQGSYKNNKYNGKELQETGMYSYGWREYIPDKDYDNLVYKIPWKLKGTAYYKSGHSETNDLIDLGNIE